MRSRKKEKSVEGVGIERFDFIVKWTHQCWPTSMVPLFQVSIWVQESSRGGREKTDLSGT